MAQKTPQYLQKRRRRWYAVLEIPKPLRPKFDGKARFVQSLETDSLSEAERLKWPLIGAWKEEIEAARTGKRSTRRDPIDLAQDLAQARNTKDAATREVREGLLSDTAWELYEKDPKLADTFVQIAENESVLTSKHIDDWLATTKNEPKTIDMKRSDVRRFATKFKYTHQIDKRAIQKWVYELQQGEHGLATTTLSRIISACRGYWDYLNRAGLIVRDDDPFRNSVQTTSKRSKSSYNEERLPFQVEDLPILLNAVYKKRDFDLWNFIMIAIWTGCRIDEIGSLKLENVSNEKFDIADAKSKAGNREVPIHTQLRPLIQRLIKDSDDGYLLSDLSPNKYGDRTNAVGKRFGRLKKSLGYSKRFVFHSIR